MRDTIGKKSAKVKYILMTLLLSTILNRSCKILKKLEKLKYILYKRHINMRGAT